MTTEIVTSEEAPTPIDLLSEAELLFCYEYLANGFKASEAFRRVFQDDSEDASQKAFRLMRRPKIRDAIKHLCTEALEPVKARGEYEIVRALELVTTFNVFDYLNIDGTIRQDLDEAQQRELGRMIQGFDPWGHPKFIDRFKCFELLSKYHKVINPESEGEGRGTINVFIWGKAPSNEDWNKARELEEMKNQAVDADDGEDMD